MDDAAVEAIRERMATSGAGYAEAQEWYLMNRQEHYEAMVEEEDESPWSVLPTDAAERKTYPLYTGLLKYFPDALAAVAHLSYVGNQQHHPDKPLHWDKSKSTDELDALMRHILDEDWDAVAWRALAHLQRELEK